VNFEGHDLATSVPREDERVSMSSEQRRSPSHDRERGFPREMNFEAQDQTNSFPLEDESTAVIQNDRRPSQVNFEVQEQAYSFPKEYKRMFVPRDQHLSRNRPTNFEASGTRGERTLMPREQRRSLSPVLNFENLDQVTPDPRRELVAAPSKSRFYCEVWR
jgi:hypothetical protein